MLGLLALSSLARAQQSESVEYYGQDVGGSVRIVWDAIGTLTSRKDYTPFGRQMSGTAIPKEGFIGQEEDQEVDQSYFHARMLMERTGRFTSIDPVAPSATNPQRWNRYAYALNNPLTFADPFGLNASASSGNSGFCPAEYSFDDCGGDSLFWIPSEGGGGGGGFGGGYAAAINAGYTPGMPEQIWLDLQRADNLIQTALDANRANIAVANNDWQTANAIVNGNADLEYGIVPDLRGVFGSYQDIVNAYIQAYIGWDNIATATWTGEGYEVTSTNLHALKNSLETNPEFESGILGLMHIGTVGGWPSDYRSLSFPSSPYSLQVTIGTQGRIHMDVDHANPYQGLSGFVMHTVKDVFGRW